MNTKQGLAPIVWVIIAAVLLGGGYAIYKKTSPLQQTPAQPSHGLTIITPKVGEQVTQGTLYKVMWQGGTGGLVCLSVTPYPQGKSRIAECVQDFGSYSLDTTKLDVLGNYSLSVKDESGNVKVDVIFQVIPALDSRTQNWKTYRNEKYGFEFQYPATWFIKDDLSETICCLNLMNTASLSEWPNLDEVKIQIQRYTKPAAMGLREFVMNSDTPGTKIEDVAIGNTQGVKTNALGDGMYFLSQSDIMGVVIIVFGHPELSPFIRRQINQILSTLTFTK